MPSCSAIQVAVTMLTPSIMACPPADGRMAPVVNPSISSLLSPASLIASRAVSIASAPRGRGDRRAIR